MFAVTPEERLAITWVAATVFIGILAHQCARLRSRPESVASINENVCKIRLNSCGIDELMTVKGIGRKLAQRIIDCRSQKGRFESIDELRMVSGMTPVRLRAVTQAAYVE